MNSELEELDISLQMSEHELKSDNGPRVQDMIRAKSNAEGWKRFTLSLPEKEFKEIEAAGEHRRSMSVQENCVHFSNLHPVMDETMKVRVCREWLRKLRLQLQWQHQDGN
jgi:hypothetical protein